MDNNYLNRTNTNMNENNSAGFTFDMPKGNSSIIKVIGVGGGGNNALKHMYERGIHGVDFVICNTDAQTLNENPVSNKVQLGVSTTEGLGAGADPEVGEKAAIESIDDIKAALGNNTKMVFVTAGMGGGTGTGAAPVVAKTARDMGILTVGIVTVPFRFEGKRRIEQASAGLERLKANVDSLIVINNDKVAEQFPDLDYEEAFFKADEVLTNAAKGMSEVITAPFKVNIDFKDAKSVLENSGTALMSIGVATGEKRAEEAVRKALDSPLLNNNKITGAKNVLLLILSGAEDGYKAKMSEITLISNYIQDEAGGDNEANVILGIGKDEELGEAIKVLVIATGFSNEGPTKNEKVVMHLGKENTEKKLSPFDKTEKIIDTESINSQPKDIYRLDDEDEISNIGFTMQDDGNTATLATPVKTSVEVDSQLGGEENTISSVDFFSNEESATQSFTFDFERETDNSDVFTSQEEQPIRFSFDVAEPSSKMEFEVSPKPSLKDQEEYAFKTVERQQEKPQEEPSPTVITEKYEEFTFINKTPNADKITERRNKLKEFNSRYQVQEGKSDFETTPAFRRKNIVIDDEVSPSQQQISTYLREDAQGNIQLRENKFLNRNVD